MTQQYLCKEESKMVEESQEQNIQDITGGEIESETQPLITTADTDTDITTINHMGRIIVRSDWFSSNMYLLLLCAIVPYCSLGPISSQFLFFMVYNMMCTVSNFLFIIILNKHKVVTRYVFYISVCMICAYVESDIVAVFYFILNSQGSLNKLKLTALRTAALGLTLTLSFSSSMHIIRKLMKPQESVFEGLGERWIVTFTILLQDLGPVVRRPISANPRLNWNLGFFIPLFKILFGIIFCVPFRASNSHILDKNYSTEFSSKAFRSEISFTLTLDYLNPALNNPALVLKLNVRHNQGATITRFNSTLVKSLGLIFQKNEIFGKACHQVIQPSSHRIV